MTPESRGGDTGTDDSPRFGVGVANTDTEAGVTTT